jgi:hypothetical protein
MRKLRTRILVGGAVAVFTGATAFAVTSTADATATTATTVALATTAAKTSTTLSISARKATIESGRRDVISGKLAQAGGVPVGRRVVELYRYDASQKKWVLARVKLTHKAGGARFIVRPLVTAEYELVYHGNDKLAGARSAPVTITVTK